MFLDLSGLRSTHISNAANRKNVPGPNGPLARNPSYCVDPINVPGSIWGSTATATTRVTLDDIAKSRRLEFPEELSDVTLEFEDARIPAAHRREPSVVAGLLRSDRSDHESRSRENGLRDRDAPQHADSGPSNGHRIAAIGQMPPQSTA